MRIIAWGAGYSGKVILSKYPDLTKQVVQVIDSDPLLWGKRMVGMEIQSPLLIDKNADCIVITARKKSVISSIREYLSISGYNHRIYNIDEFIQEQNIQEGKECMFSFTDAMEMPLDEIRVRLQDELSRKLFEARLYAYSTWDVSVYIKSLIAIDRVDGTLPVSESNHVRVEDDKLSWLKKQTEMKPEDRKPIILVGINESQQQMLRNLGLEAIGYIDRGDRKPQGSYESLPELTMQEAMEKYPDGWYLSTLSRDEAIKNMMVKMGLRDAQFLIYHTAWREQYFDEEFLVPDENGVFVDCGVYNLNNTLEYINWCGGNYENIYAIEPDVKCYQKCLSRLTKMPKADRNRVNLINAAVGEINGRISFDSFSESGNYMVPVCSIDQVLDGEKVTYIKMDIEGAELSALKGSIKSIQKWKPRMAICIYHKRKDIYELPLYILSLRPDYKFYIRHYASCSAETVLYCI